MREPVPLSEFEFFRDDWGAGLEPDADDPSDAVEPWHLGSDTVVDTSLNAPRSDVKARRVRSDLAPINTTHITQPDASAGGHFGLKPDYINEVWDTSDMDWDQIKSLRIAATNEISQRRSNRNTWTEAEEHALGREVIEELVNRWVSEEMRIGRNPDAKMEPRIRDAVFAALFGMGRLQPLIESDYIENIEIYGCDVVHIELKDGTLVDGPAIADSDEELIGDLQFWASRSKANPRPFSPSTPRMNLPLGERARLAAMSWVTLRPVVTVRLHGMVEVTFDDLIERGTVTPLAADFLTGVIRSGASVVVAGAQGAGKTTLTRVLCSTLPPSERIITFETDRELHLEKMPDRHPRVFGVEARLGSGEFRPDGREAGVFDISEALREALRHNADRLIVGEVRGGEIMGMLQAMQSGTGSISTTHARSGRDAYNKLVTCCLEVEGISESYATRAIAAAINYIVFIKKVNIARPGQPVQRVRRVTEILAVELTSDGVAYTDVFKADSQGIARAQTAPPFLEDIMEAGFDYDGFVLEANMR